MPYLNFDMITFRPLAIFDEEKNTFLQKFSFRVYFTLILGVERYMYYSLFHMQALQVLEQNFDYQ